MGSRIERIKEAKANLQENLKDNAVVKHVKSNKNVYIPIVCVAVTGFVMYHYSGNKTPGTVTNTVSQASVGGDIQMAGRDVINHYNAPKRLSYIVTDGEDWWDTQAAAAKALGERASDISNHLNHGVDLKSGVKLERKGVRS